MSQYKEYDTNFHVFTMSILTPGCGGNILSQMLGDRVNDLTGIVLLKYLFHNWKFKKDIDLHLQ